MKLSSDIYANIMDFLKKRSIEFIGLLLITLFVFFIFSLINYTPEKSTIIFQPGNLSDTNIFYTYANQIADFFLQSFVYYLFSLLVFFPGNKFNYK